MDSVIALVGHVALRVRDLETAVPYSSELFGLKVAGEADDRVYLTEGAPHHSLVYIAAEEDALDHVGLLATDGNALAEIKQRAERGGFEILSDEPLNPATGEALVIEGPENFVFEVSVGQEKLPPEQRPLGALPKRFGHVNFVTGAGKEVVDFLIGVFDFRLSDEVAGGGWFLRCNVDHHGIGVFPGAGKSRLHHYAWEARGIEDIARFADRVDQRGESVLWGPGRHAIGRNVASYVDEPCGIVVEFYADMERIYHDLTHTPGYWNPEDGHKWFSLWNPQLPDGFLDLGVPSVARTKAA